MSKATHVEYGPAIPARISQGDDSKLETNLRMKQKMRDEVCQAALDHAEGKISKETHDMKIRQAHYSLSDEFGD